MEAATTLTKMKVADLKKELKTRGLSVVGNKTDLVERLQEAMECAGDSVEMEGGEAGEEDFDEEEILGEEELDSELTPQEEEAALGGAGIRVKEDSTLLEPPEKKKISLKRSQPPPLTSPSPEPAPPSPPQDTPAPEGEGGTETTSPPSPSDPTAPPAKKIIKLDGTDTKADPKARAERFGIPLTEEGRKEARKARFGTATNGSSEGAKGTSQSEEEKKLARANRFGISATTTTTTAASTTTTTNKISMEGEKVEIDRLMKRAERFGEVTSPALLKASEEDKKKARMKRFGETGGKTTTTTTTTTTTEGGGGGGEIEAKNGATKKEVEVGEEGGGGEKKKPKFGLITANDEDEKKRKRAQRFAI